MSDISGIVSVVNLYLCRQWLIGLPPTSKDRYQGGDTTNLTRFNDLQGYLKTSTDTISINGWLDVIDSFRENITETGKFMKKLNTEIEIWEMNENF